MSNQLTQYTISLSIKNIKHADNPTALDQLTSEFAMRPHLQFNNITKVTNGEFEEINVELSCWGLTKESAEKQASEELFEIACAILSQPKGISVHIMN